MPCEESVIRLLRRFVGAVVLLLFTVGIVGCAAGVVGMWRSYQAYPGRCRRSPPGSMSDCGVCLKLPSMSGTRWERTAPTSFFIASRPARQRPRPGWTRVLLEPER
jgi:hypothetical protein